VADDETGGVGDAVRTDYLDVGVSCGHCGGNVYMATCNGFRGTGHEWVMASLCMICRAVHWTDGCLQCKEEH
jgi:hypothetical protein